MSSSGEYFRDLVSGRQRGPWPALQRAALGAASVPYGLAVRTRNWLFDRGWRPVQTVAVPVVSVGNLTLGGTGKTPCVEHLARFYRRCERRVAILSRGYGSAQGRNDEALVLEENLPDVPHLQGADRAALAAVAVEELESEVLILDDGFQHRRLARDLDLVLVDATDPWGQGRLFPRGLLREPATGLRRAHAVLLTRCDQVDAARRQALRQAIGRIAPAVPVAECTHQPVELVDAQRRTAAVEELRGRTVAAFCGIGNPEAFRQTLCSLGAVPARFRVFPDHHAYTRADVDDLRAWAEQCQGQERIVTTQKDLVKLRLTRLGGRELWALRIGLHVEDGAAELERQLRHVLSASARYSRSAS